MNVLLGNEHVISYLVIPFGIKVTGLKGVWRDADIDRCGSAPFPSLVRRGGREAPGVVCSKPRSHLIDSREALLINRYCSTLNRPPQPSLREGIPALLRRGMASLLGEEGKKLASIAILTIIGKPLLSGNSI
jgi:hypothetical protein